MIIMFTITMKVSDTMKINYHKNCNIEDIIVIKIYIKKKINFKKN